MSSVTVSRVTKSFGAVRAVQDVSFEVNPGEIFGLLGPNGAGKTTTIRMMLDIFAPDSGSVEVFGGPWTEAKKDRVGYLPEDRGLYKDQRLDQVLIYLATLKGLSEAEAKRRLVPWLERLDLVQNGRQKVETLSKGMQQKAQLIAALLHEPELVVIDEPFSGLDPVNTRLVEDIILEQAAAGHTVIMSTHQMHQVEALCTRILLVNRGRAVLYGPVAEIKHGFAGNAVHVSGDLVLDGLAGVVEARRHNGDWELSLATGVDPQTVLRELIQRDGVRIERFEVAEPSLEDIFVAVVQEAPGERSPAEESVDA